MEVNAGNLSKRIEIIRRTKTKDKDGYETVTDTVVRTPWAQFSRTSGTEAQRAGAEMEDIKVRFLIRSGKSRVSRKDVVRYDRDEYEIEYVNDYGDAGEYTELICRRIDTGG